MVISWWRTWWRRQRSRAQQRPVWLCQRGLGLENLEDRRLLSAVLTPDPILKALEAAESPTAHVALISGNQPILADDVVDVGAATPLSAVIHTATGKAHAAGRHHRALHITGASSVDSGPDLVPAIHDFPGAINAGPVPISSVPEDHAESIGSPATLDATFAAVLNPVAGDSGQDGFVVLASPTDQEPEPQSADASPIRLDNTPTPENTPISDNSSPTTDAFQAVMIVPPDPGASVNLTPVDSAPSPASPMAPVQGLSVDLPPDPNSPEPGGTGNLSGGDIGVSSGTVVVGPLAEAVGGLSTGNLAQGNAGHGKRGGQDSASDAAGQGDQSTGFDEDTGSGFDDNSASQKGGGKSSGSADGQADHSQADQGADWGGQVEATDTSTSSVGRHSGQHGGRGRNSDGQVTEDATDQDSPVADSATDRSASFATDTSARQSAATDSSAIPPVGNDLAADMLATVTVPTVRHHHHRMGPFYFPTISAADLSYTVDGWSQDGDIGIDGADGYFSQSYDFTTKVGSVSSFRPDSLAHSDKALNLVEKAAWRSLGSALHGANGTLVVIGWGNTGSALFAGESSVEGLDLVYSVQAAVSRGVGVTGAHRVPARASQNQDPGLGDRNLALTEPGVFLAARSPQVGDASHPVGQSVQQVVASALEGVAQEGMAHLVSGSLRAQHLNTDGDKPDSSQRLDGRGWWGIVAQFILAPQFPHNHQPTIMLAVADEPSRDALNIALVKANFMVLTAATAREAMKLLRTPLSPVDVALLDVHLPDVNGVDLCSRLRELYPTLPVLVCTEQAEQGDVSQLEKLNVLRVFSKPVAVGELLAAVKGIVS
jgi:CheY-like chemotaxis protein